jgi:hypothetical protein
VSAARHLFGGSHDLGRGSPYFGTLPLLSGNQPETAKVIDSIDR